MSELSIKRDALAFRKILILIFIGMSGFFLKAQTPNQQSGPNVIDKIVEQSDSSITIDIPPTILEVILQTNPIGKGGVKGPANLKPGVNRTNGYRIQVFSDGRNPSTLESRAKARGKAVLSRFPKYKGQVYTTSSSPNWYTRVGNFASAEEANKALAELKSAFPSFAGEMRIVKSPIILIKK